jgi:hypothetical protein
MSRNTNINKFMTSINKTNDRNNQTSKIYYRNTLDNNDEKVKVYFNNKAKNIPNKNAQINTVVIPSVLIHKGNKKSNAGMVTENNPEIVNLNLSSTINQKTLVINKVNNHNPMSN